MSTEISSGGKRPKKRINKKTGCGCLTIGFLGLLLFGACGAVFGDGADEPAPSSSPTAAEVIETAAPNEEPVPEEAERSEEGAPTEESESSEETPASSADDPMDAVVETSGVDGAEAHMEGDVLFVEFPIADNFSNSMITTGAQTDTVDILEATNEHVANYSRVVVQGRFPMQDEYGNSNDKIILNAGYLKEDVDKINFDGVAYDRIWDLMDSGMVHPELRGE